MHRCVHLSWLMDFVLSDLSVSLVYVLYATAPSSCENDNAESKKYIVSYDHLLLCCTFAADPGFERDSYYLSEIVGYRVFSVRH